MNLNVFLERQAFPDYKLRAPANGKLQTMIVHESVSGKSLRMLELVLKSCRQAKSDLWYPAQCSEASSLPKVSSPVLSLNVSNL